MAVSLLFATLAGMFISVADKGLRGWDRIGMGGGGYPLPPLVLQKIVVYGFRGWGSAKRLWGKDLDDRRVERRG